MINVFSFLICVMTLWSSWLWQHLNTVWVPSSTLGGVIFYIWLKDLRDKLINELNNLDRKIEKLNTLEKIEYFYYSKNYSEKKEKKKKDNKGIKLIKTFIKDMYFKFGKTNNKKDE